jgi:glycosyltransferase involved in cell wall biosynthesis
MIEKISIIVPLFNYKQYVEENINSITSQSYGNWEIIIVDDASTDDPYPAIEPYLSDKIKYIKLETNVGYGSAKNVGIKNSSGSLIVVLDADDMLSEKSLELRVDYLTRKKYKWIHAECLEFVDTKPYVFKRIDRKSNKKFREIQRSGNYKKVWQYIHAQTVMVKREVYEKVGLYEPTLRSMGDKEMWARICHHVGIPGHIDKSVALYRQHDKQMHRSKDKIDNLEKIRKHMMSLVDKRKYSLEGVEIL